MKYTIKIEAKALKSIKKFPKKDALKIKDAIESLSDDPRPIGHIKMKGNNKPSRYRLRVGNYRVIYHIKDKELFVIIIDIGNRKNIYE